jgi:hypothetical protein
MRKLTFKQSLTALCLGATLTLPAWAASSATSSASESIGASVGSSATSVGNSSDSSTGNKVAAGDYKIIDVAVAAADRPGLLRLHLQQAELASDADANANANAYRDFYLYLPAATFATADLAVGQVVSARQHAYGLAFAKPQTQQAFFLVLTDAWYQELNSKAVVL